MRLFLALSIFFSGAVLPVLAQVQSDPNAPSNTPTNTTPTNTVPSNTPTNSDVGVPASGSQTPVTEPSPSGTETPPPEPQLSPPASPGPATQRPVSNPNAFVVVLNSRIVQNCYALNRCTATLQGTVKNNTGQLVYAVGLQPGVGDGGRSMAGSVTYLPLPTLNPGTVTNFSINLPLEQSRNAARVIRVLWRDATGAAFVYEPKFSGGNYLCGFSPCSTR